MFIEPLDLQLLLLNSFAGTTEIFTFVAIIVISVLAGMFRMNNKVYLAMIALFGVMLSEFIGGLYILIILFAGLIIFWAIARIAK